jgi:hypothetical protein
VSVYVVTTQKLWYSIEYQLFWAIVWQIKHLLRWQISRHVREEAAYYKHLKSRANQNVFVSPNGASNRKYIYWLQCQQQITVCSVHCY